MEWSSVTWRGLSEDRRLDAEHYRPEYLCQAEALSRFANKPLQRVADVTDGNHISIAESFCAAGIRYLRGQDLSDFFISDAEPVFIPVDIYEKLSRSHMLAGDVLLGIVGTIGTVSLVTDRFERLTGNCKIAIVRPRELEGEYLAAFLACGVGQREIRRRIRGTVQTGLILPDLKDIPIPILPVGIRGRICRGVREAEACRRAARESYVAAEAKLSEALGLERVDLTARLSYERVYKDTEKAGRLDAEYYQPAKWEILDALARMSGDMVVDHYRPVRDLFEPGKAPPGETVRNYDLSDAIVSFLDESVEPMVAREVGSTKKRLEAGDFVVSRLRSYLQEMALVLPSGSEPLVGSSEFIVLRRRAGGIRAEALLVYLRSAYVQTILKWCQDGSNHPRFDERELLGLRIPEAVQRIQDEVAELVSRTIEWQREARRLLDEAKATVEAAILEDA